MRPMSTNGDSMSRAREDDGARQTLLPLPPDAVDLWVGTVGQPCEIDLAHQFDTVLSEDERQRHARFVFEQDRHRYLYTRALLRNVLSRYRPVHPADWRFAVTAYGRPFIANEPFDAASLTFNLSHSERTVVLALSCGCELGVDVEDLRPSVPLAVADRYFAAGEVRQLRAVPIEARPQRFLDFWTLKESYIKARGQGLSLPLNGFEFELMRPGSLRFHADAAVDDRPERWAFWQWRPSASSVAALCVARPSEAATSVTVRRASFCGAGEDMAFDVTRMSMPALG